ncbi:MAG: beta-L-arabinofuranosidase domain-containing protein [Pedobacter sp.]
MKLQTLLSSLGYLLFSLSLSAQTSFPKQRTQLTKAFKANIHDAFWSSKLETWATTTANDVLNKFEGKHLPVAEQVQNNVFNNFDKVAAGNLKGGHVGLPWFDGLIYESIRGIGDLIGQYPNAAIEARLDNYIAKIYAAQKADPEGYLNTYTQLTEPTHRWGDNGGMLRYQHDVYNAGMLIEAGVHYYNATGKTKLLTVATKYANYMANLMGPFPKRNIIPAHAGPEEAMMKLYWLYKQHPEVKSQIEVPVNEKAYYDLCRFWIENRGNNAGYPLWQTWGSAKSESWIKSQKYKEINPGNGTRPGWGDYAQDSISVFKQKTIEGHAVRATLLATGIAAVALENHSDQYIKTADQLWNNMVGKRMFITGGVGAIADDEKFGPDYFLPTDAYLETCAAVGAGFFSQRMNELTGNGTYMDEFERVLYNNVLTGISLKGDNYTYQNPLNSHDHSRWDWHSCPCCPPMFLKMVAELPNYIYALAGNQLFVNMFIGSDTKIKLLDKTEVSLTQTTNYPWGGHMEIRVDPSKQKNFSVSVRIPGWARGKENPYDLYTSDLKSAYKIRLNGKILNVNFKDGYATINRVWKKGDRIVLELPMKPRYVKANKQVPQLTNMVTLASGPIVYSLESADNTNLDGIQLDTNAVLQLQHNDSLLDGINVITGKTATNDTFTAIPYYALGNRPVKSHKVWLPLKPVSKIRVKADKVENKISPLLYGSNVEDVNHEIYGGFYDQRVFGESFEEPATDVNANDWRKYAGYWTAKEGIITIIPGRNTVSIVQMNGNHNVPVEPDHSAKLIYDRRVIVDGTVAAELRFPAAGESAGLLIRVNNEGIGDDSFDGYEISLNSTGKKLLLGRHQQNFKALAEAVVNVDPKKWNKLKVAFTGAKILVSLNSKLILSYSDDQQPLAGGRIGLRTWKSHVEFKNITLSTSEGSEALQLSNDPGEVVSYYWDVIRSSSVKSDFVIDAVAAYNGKVSQVINYVSGKGKVGLANRGLNRWGIAVRKNQNFQGRLYLKSLKFKGAVTVALESADGSKTYASTVLSKIPTSWKKYPFKLTSNSLDKNARLAIYMESKGKLWIDQVVLSGNGEDQFKGMPIRADIGNMLVAQGLTFLRYAGTMVNSPDYKFKNMIGDPDLRPPYRGHWNHYTTNGFGIEEFLQFCEATSITPCFAVNIYETPDDMADMVEYFNGDQSTKWGAKRAKNGHLKPYGIKYIEIGNEEVIFNGDKKADYQHYVERFKLLHEAMIKKDSSLKFIQAAWWRPESPNMEYVFRALNGKADYWDLHVGGDDPRAGIETDKQLTGMINKFKSWDSNTKMQIAVFEENGSKHGIQRALGHATNLNTIRKHSEYVLTSSPANALQPYRQNDNDWDQGQIFFSPNQVWGMPPFYAQKMQAENHLPLRVESVVAGELNVTATRSEDAKTLVLHVVNVGPDIATSILLEGFKSSGQNVQIYSISGDLNAKNSPEKPDQYKTEGKVVKLALQNPSYIFPANSYTILKFRQ